MSKIFEKKIGRNEKSIIIEDHLDQNKVFKNETKPFVFLKQILN